jgi:hypothetical protein
LVLSGETEWLGKDHPYVVRGMGSLHDAVASFECADLKEKRRRALSHGLESRGLVVEVTVLDDRCAAFIEGNPRLTIKLDRLIVLSRSSVLGWFLHVSLIVIIKGRSPMEVSLIVIINQV